MDTPKPGWSWRPTGASVARFLALLSLLALGVLGVSGGLKDFPGAETGMQRVQAAFQFAYGICAITAMTLLLRRRPGLRKALYAWGAAFLGAAVLAPLAWTEATWSSAVLAGLLAFTIAVAIGWMGLRGNAE